VLQGCVLRDEARRVVGWFLYYLSSSMSQVLQLGARRERLPAVLDRLFEHPRDRGAVAIQGRLEPGEWWTRFSGGSPAPAPRAYLRRIRAPRMYAFRPWKSRAKEFALPS
jgi:hypothetical protein